VSDLAARLDLAVIPFLGEPCEPGFEWLTAGEVLHVCGVGTKGMADPEGFEVRFEGVTRRGWMLHLGARMVRSWVWTTAMPDHLDGGWCACAEGGGQPLLCKVVDDGFE
jgi:hypothetical protein